MIERRRFSYLCYPQHIEEQQQTPCGICALQTTKRKVRSQQHGTKKEQVLEAPTVLFAQHRQLVKLRILRKETKNMYAERLAKYRS